MCGIAGILKFNSKPISIDKLKCMTNVITHRGPDGEGHWVNANGIVGFGHRRLSIIDLTESGKQPMHYAQGKYTITFNGEIYNYIELRERLIFKGYKFHSNTDTEVLLALYDLKKEKCLDDLDGMFAFAIWDEKEQILFCARDRFGEKPFYYYKDDKAFIFGSEIKQIFEVGVEKKVNELMLYNYLVNEKYVIQNDTKQTFFDNVYQLPHSHFMIINAKREINIKKYYTINYTYTNQNINIDEASEQFSHLFNESIKLRLRADVSIGTSLSGGLDSTSIAASLLTKHLSHLNTFTATFPGFEKDEKNYVDILKKKYQHISDKYTFPNVAQLNDDLRKLIWHHDEPIASTSVYAQYKVMQLASQNNITVLLDGQGSDEYISGYNKFWPVLLRQTFKTSNSDYYKQKALISKYLNINYSINFKLKLFLKFPLNKQLSFSSNKGNQNSKTNYKNPFNHSFNAQIFDNEINWSDLNEVLHNALLHDGLQELLKYADRNSMAHSREVRLPFLSHHLVEFVFSLPKELKMNDAWSKLILRTSMNKILPNEICWRREKVGFATPQSEWMANKNFIELATISREKIANSKLLKKEIVTNLDNWKAINLSNLFE